MPETRLLIFHPALAPYRVDLFNALDERYRLRIVFLNKDVTYQSYDQAALRRGLRAECEFLERGFTVAGRQVRFGIGSAIGSFRPDLVVTHEFSQTTFAVSARARRACLPHVVWTADNPDVIAAESPFRRCARRLVKRRLDGLIVYSEETAAYYRERFGFARPIGISPNAQGERALRTKLEGALERARALVEQHRLTGRKVLLYVGRLAAVKRLDLLVDAFAAIRSESPESLLVLVGDGPEREALEARAAARGVQGDTLFAGHVEGTELYAWFNCGAVLALTSERETWGAVVDEALAAGMPVVCSARAGARVLIDGRTNGEIVDPNDAERLASSLGRWLESAERLRAGDPARLRRSLATQTFEDAVQGFCAVVDAVVSRSGPERR